ncbi:helix-turn-helix transcriptional regulator [Actinomadura sp. NPDC048021]
MTIRSVSDATGISVSTLSRLESGNRRPSLSC